MLCTNSIEKLLRMQDIIVKDIQHTEKSTIVDIELWRKPQICPHCGQLTTAVHDYRVQEIKDIPILDKNTIYRLRKRRYRCECGKRFAEQNTFLPRYHRMTNRLAFYVLQALKDVCSFTSVARRVNLSTPTVIRIFNLVNYPHISSLPEVVAFDEFKGNTWGEKYQCIVTDPDTGVVLDILPKRYSHYLSQYFKNVDRSNVKFFVSDMWKTYADFASIYFKNAVQIVDKYHWIRQGLWAFEAVRKEEQKKFSKTHRIYFKRSKLLLTKRFNSLSDEQKQRVNVMLYASVGISSAYFLKEQFLKIFDCKDKTTAKKLMSDWILDAQNSGIPAFFNCAKTMINWSTGILNSLDLPYTNGFTEGCNNKIKVLKRNAYGYKNFERFRNRILHIFSYQKDKIKQGTIL